jgi:predicted MFS family arabinose efflux permease
MADASAAERETAPSIVAAADRYKKNRQSPSHAYAFYALTLFASVNILNYFDRNVFAILIQPIKDELKLTDGQLGLLLGVALGLIYSLGSVPIARLADRGRRVTVLSLAVGIWALMTALSGFARNFFTMFLARFGVGIGEAGGLPAMHALIADYFPLEKRGTALSIIYVAQSIGVPLGLFFGGVINDALGWRAAFWIVGTPGVLIALLIRFTVAERRLADQAACAARVSGPTFRQAIGALWRRRAYPLFCIGSAFIFVAAYAQQNWTPTFLIRSFQVSTSDAGFAYAIANGPVAIAGTLLSGLVLDRLMLRDTRWPLRLVLLSFCTAFPFALGTYLMPNYRSAVLATILAGFLGAIATAPMYALVQALAGSQLRATAAAIFITTTNVAGLTLGPTATGFLSDLLKSRVGDADALRYSLLATAVPAILGILLLFVARRTVRVDIAKAVQEST